MEKEVVLQYSGGTDSTLAACIVAEQFDRVHLITYKRFGFFHIINSLNNIVKLKEKYGENKFVHGLIPLDKLNKKVYYDNFLLNLMRYRFFLISCGLCKLAMHVRTIIYCLDNKISYACDGASQGMQLFPNQMPCIIEEIKKMYAYFKIIYFNPVFNFEAPRNIDFADRLHFERIPLLDDKNSCASYEYVKKTAGYKLYELGLMPFENVKGTKLDHKMQYRCFQFIPFYIWLHWYYFPAHTYKQYEEMNLKFFGEKIEIFAALISDYLKRDRRSKLHKFIEY